MAATMPYSGLSLDRAGSRRGDPAFIAAMLAKDDTRFIPMWRDNCLTRDGVPVVLSMAGAHSVLPCGDDPVWLGSDKESAAFAVDLSTLDEADAIELCAADSVRDVRSVVFSIAATEASTLAYARGILHWHRHQRFCGACGGGTRARDGGHVRVCGACDKLLFPRIEPAIIVLVDLPGEPRRCLLGRHHGAGPDNYGTLAGFVEIGESLEDTVRREVAEEAGVTVGPVRYLASQAWPFPAGLMVGFQATALSESIAADGAELLDARWFTADDLRSRMARAGSPKLFRPDSIGRFLLERWLSAGES